MIKNILIGLALSTLFSFQYACSQGEATKAEGISNNVKNAETIAVDLNTDAFYAQVTNHPGQLVDVRTPEEFAAGHITNAINIDFKNSGFKSNLSQLDKNQPVYLYCGSGNRSGQAKNVLVDEGFTVIYNHKGYFQEWVSKGYPVSK